MNPKIYEYFNKVMTEAPRGWHSFDTWGNPEEAYVYSLFKDKDKKLIGLNGKLYFIYHSEGGGCGMGECPDSVIVTIVIPYNVEKIEIK